MASLNNSNGKNQPTRSSASPMFPLIPTSKLAQVEDAAALENEEANEAGYKGYVSRVFTQVSLPYKDPLKVDPSLRAWKRRNGDMTLKVEPGEITYPDGHSAYELPYGKYPRLILPWLTTNIVRRDREESRASDGTMTIALPASTRAFFTELGLQQSGIGSRQFTAQLRRLFKARFEVSEVVTKDSGFGERSASFQVADGFQLWFSKDAGELAQGGLWNSEVVVSARFVDDLLEVPIPIDLRALSVLAGSGPLAMDMYSWLNYRLPAARRSSVVPWELLNWQFGGQYKLVRQFKAQFLKHLPAVQIVYPGAQVDVQDQGLFIRHSPPATPYKRLRSEL